jgi:chemotaxis protein CheX
MHVISGFIQGAVTEVFSTMAGLECQCDEQASDVLTPPLELTGVSGSISITGPKVSGVVYLNFPGEISQKVSQRIMGSDTPLSESEVNDVVGELTNMVTGNLKSKLADKGFNCQLSIPTVIRGKEISVDSNEAPLSLSNSFAIAELASSVTCQVFAKLEGNI